MRRFVPRLRALIAACAASITVSGEAAAVEPPPLVVAGGLAGVRGRPAAAAATGAVAWRHEDASRILPVGLAATAGFSIGYTAIVTEDCHGPMCGLQDVAGVTLGVLGGLVGGGVGLLTTGESEGRAAVAVSSAVLTILLAAVRLGHAW